MRRLFLCIAAALAAFSADAQHVGKEYRLRRTGKVAWGAKAGRLELLREMSDLRRVGEIEGLSIDPLKDDLVVLNNRGTQIVLGISQGPIVEEGYDREIHELYIYEKVR